MAQTGLTKKQRMEQYKSQVEKSVIFNDNVTGHIFTRGALLGKGGFGFVYVTTMPGYTRRMVLKAIPTARIVKPSQRHRINTEVSLHKSLKHDSIAKLYHSFEEEHVICMVIERCERSLLDLLSSQNRKVKLSDGSVVIRQVLQALNYLHSRKIIHRDIKLGNVLLKQDLVVKLIDFGLAKEYNPADKPTICGTPNYLAPEVLLHKGHRPVSDIWSVGCVLVVLLSGLAPFEGETTDETYDMIIHSEPKLPSDMPAYAIDFLKETLVKDHDTRLTGVQLLEHTYIKEFRHISPRGVAGGKSPDTGQGRKIVNVDLCKFINRLPAPTVPLVIEEYGNAESTGVFTWVQCWIDYTNKDCGFAYRISNDTIGVKLKINKISYIVKRHINRRSNTAKYEYFSESRNKLIEFVNENTNDDLKDERFKKHVDEMKNLVDYYDEYMSAHLINNIPSRLNEENYNSKIKLLDWVKNKTFVAMVLTNYTVQINFFMTHFKVIFQGQFDADMRVPFLPTSPVGKNKLPTDQDLSVISMENSDVPQPFKIIFINNKRSSFELNPEVILPLLKYGPCAFGAGWAEHTEETIGVTLDELYLTLLKAHKAMHNLTVFSSNCYYESQICHACIGNADDNSRMNPNCYCNENTNEFSHQGCSHKISDTAKEPKESTQQVNNINPSVGTKIVKRAPLKTTVANVGKT